MHKTGESVSVQFVVCDPTTGGLVDADSLPSGVLVLNAANHAAAVTVTNLATGIYRAVVTLPTLVDGDELQLRIAATVGGVAGGGIVWQGEGVTARPADLAAALSAILEDTSTTLPAQIAALAVVPLASGGSAPAAGTLTIRRGDTVTLPVSGLGSLAGRLQLWWGGKIQVDDLDDKALAIVEETDGLLVCGGVDASSLDTDQTATLTVTDEAAGNITIVLSAAATAALRVRSTAVWDVQIRTAAGVTTLAAGTLVITADVVRAVE